MNLRSRKKLLLFIPLLILALMLGACEPAEEGLVEEPAVEEPVVEEPLEEEPLEEEPAVEEPVEEEPILEEEPGVSVDPVMLSSDLIGLEITNDFDDQVAEVSDVLVDPQGMIRFVIFDAGGFLGIGERTTAVDWSLFEVTPQDTGGATVVFVGGAEALETAPEVDAAVLAEPDLVLDAAQLGLPEELDGLIQVAEFEDFDLMDYNLINLQGEDLGEIEQVVLDLVQGQVTYAIAEIGGFLGLGENSIAIPWGQLQIDMTENTFVVPYDQATLEAAPIIDPDTWIDPANPDFDADVQEFWETAPVAEVEEEVVEEDVEEEAMAETPGLIQASDLVGLNLANAADEDLGEVSDVFVDETGLIRYIIVDDNIGIGWNEFQANLGTFEGTDNANLDFEGDTIEDLGVAPEIDDEFLNQEGFVFSADELGIDTDYNVLFQLSEFVLPNAVNFNLINFEPDVLGEVEDLLIDLSQGRATYAIADIGGFLNLGETTVLIPWNGFFYDLDNDSFVLDADQATLENAPTVDLDALTEAGFDDPDWDAEIREYWGIE